MKLLALTLSISLALLAAWPSGPAGAGEIWRYNRHGAEPPYPVSARAASVWDSRACFDACGSYTAWNMVACLERDAQGHCLKRTDAADRACQRACRTRGGPLLSIDTLFPLAF